MISDLVYYTLETGLIYGLIALGIYLTLRIVDFPDLTVNSSFTLGAAVSTVLIINGFPPIVSTFSAILMGFFAGAATAFLNLQCKIQNLLSSIIIMIGLHSINLRIMGKPNLVLLDQEVIYTNSNSIIITASIVIIITIMLAYFLSSEIGLGIRVSGQNPIMGNAYGVDYNKVVYSVLILSNGLTSLAGSLLSQLQGFCDIGMGNGVIVIGLASVIVGERIISSRNMLMISFSCLLGAIVYNTLIAISLDAADSILRASDIYIITAVLIVFIMLSKRNNERGS
ncbi:MAG: ABC-type uncharacterized transport system, permease component [Candidatus Midichloria mitochondrii]|uniref:ABC transporter permease n=1 Tax=Midichloria mitochondrii (strain IricVA) TaxID=696127 RepID=F7XVU1_MIDMI|nr:ABC transporter permease [Candidatus Midichloria mitochondrii]AEI88790.1 ABC transporter permease [Candidatus Midichloria mitochondrii IricVA]MDJ1256112.1 ABC transporter permease [Candidatus Midichloria mitochondrii]MDJ1298647.1 ABC transporter permease [Candidatus Midichloria mitochondrii]MDJ1583093.1 ABC transporter permease [Candidatus Midichloria mitochondrii]